MFNFFIDRPVLSTVISLIITLAGLVASVGLPLSQYPQIVPPQGIDDESAELLRSFAERNPQADLRRGLKL